ncbi:MAG: class I SAM-dependent methyltransferase [Litorilinea sp.]
MAQSVDGNTAYTPPVMDYEGSRYRTEFWEGQSRQYEDAVERLVLQAMVPDVGPSKSSGVRQTQLFVTGLDSSGAARRPVRRIAEIGAGFGRLADLYLDYDQIILFDYSRTLLRDAVERWGDDPRFIFVAGNVYDLPLATGSLDALVMVRVMHHLVDVPRALSQLRRVLHHDSVAVVEYANKRNLKAYARWLMGRQSWSPMVQTPVEFVKLNFDFHPAWMQRRFEQARFRVMRQVAVSHFRLPLLKRLVPASILAGLDAQLFDLGGKFPLSPSVFVRLLPVDTDAVLNAEGVVPGMDAAGSGAPAGAAFENMSEDMHENAVTQSSPIDAPESVAQLFCCPRCFAEGSFEQTQSDRVVCRVCDAAFGQQAGIWDFKELLQPA